MWRFGGVSRYIALNTGYGTQVTAPSGANTKSGWTQISAAIPVAAAGLLLEFTGNNQSNWYKFLVDVGIGSAGNEQVIASNLLVSGADESALGLSLNAQYILPIAIPTGSRVAVRLQASTGSKFLFVKAQIMVASFPLASSVSRMSTLGAVTSDSGGTEIDPGGTINTKGSWVELAAATIIDIQKVIVVINTPSIQTYTKANVAVDIGIGLAGNEQVVLPDLNGLFNTNFESTFWPRIPYGPFPLFIPSGVRVAARSQCAINTASIRNVDVIVYGFS